MGSQEGGLLTLVRGGALGDFVVTLPLVRALVATGRPVRLVGNAAAAAALAPELFADVVSFEDRRWMGLFDDGVPLPAPDGDAIVLVRDEGVAARMRRARWGRVTWSTPHPPPESAGHVAQWLGRAAGLELALDERQIGARDGSGGAYAVLHPGSGSARKNWAVERFVAVGDELRAEGLDVRWVGGPADGTVLAALRRTRPDAPVAEGLSLPDLVELLGGAALYLGNDSGVSHVAGALGTPTVAVFGPTRALRWRPLGPHVRTVEPPERCLLCAGAEQRPVDCDCLGRVTIGAVLAATREVRG